MCDDDVENSRRQSDEHHAERGVNDSKYCCWAHSSVARFQWLMYPEFSVSVAKVDTIYPLRIPTRYFLLATRYQLPVMLLDPLRISILQHIQGPGGLHRRVIWANISKSELKDSATPTVPA